MCWVGGGLDFGTLRLRSLDRYRVRFGHICSGHFRGDVKNMYLPLFLQYNVCVQSGHFYNALKS